MSDVAAERDRLLCPCQTLVVADCIAGDCWPGHRGRGLVVGVVTSTAAQLGQISHDGRRKDPRG